MIGPMTIWKRAPIRNRYFFSLHCWWVWLYAVRTLKHPIQILEEWTNLDFWTRTKSKANDEVLNHILNAKRYKKNWNLCHVSVLRFSGFHTIFLTLSCSILCVFLCFSFHFYFRIWFNSIRFISSQVVRLPLFGCQ